MKDRTTRFLNLLALLVTVLVAGGCAREEPVSFRQAVKPVLDQYCVECHQEGGVGYETAGLDLTTYATLMRGARNGPMVIPGDSMGSNLVVLMEGRADASIRMPHQSREKVSQAQINKIRLWIDQGANDN